MLLEYEKEGWIRYRQGDWSREILEDYLDNIWTLE